MIIFSGSIKTDMQKKWEPQASKLKAAILVSGVIKTNITQRGLRDRQTGREREQSIQN
jgi:hypothetical protein